MNLSTSTSTMARGPEDSRAAGVVVRLVGRVPRAQSAVASPGCRGRTQPRRSSNPAPAGAGATAEAGRFPPFARAGRALDVAITNPRIPAPCESPLPGACTRRGSATRGAAKQQRDGSERRAGDVAAHRQSGAGRRARAQSPAKPRASRGEWQTTHGQESPLALRNNACLSLGGAEGTATPLRGGGGGSLRDPDGEVGLRAEPRTRAAARSPSGAHTAEARTAAPSVSHTSGAEHRSGARDRGARPGNFLKRTTNQRTTNQRTTEE